MDTRLYFFIEILTVLLFHEVVLCKCDLKIKNYNYLIQSNVNQFHRNGRQTPPIVYIDETHVYAPQRTEQVAPGGYGVQAAQQSGKNKGGHGENGPGRVASAGHIVYVSTSGSANGPPSGLVVDSDAPTVHFVEYGSAPEGNGPGRSPAANNGHGNVQIEQASVTVGSSGEKLPNGGADYGRVVAKTPTNAQPAVHGQGPAVRPNLHNENSPAKISNYNENGLSPAAEVTGFQNPGGFNQQTGATSQQLHGQTTVVVKTNGDSHPSYPKDVQNHLPPLGEPIAVPVLPPNSNNNNNNNYTVVRFGATQTSFSSYTSQVWHSTQTSQTHGTGFAPLPPEAASGHSQGGSTSSLVGAEQGQAQYQLIQQAANVFGQSRPQQPSDTRVDGSIESQTTIPSSVKENINYQSQGVASGNGEHDQGLASHGYTQNIAPATPPKVNQNGYTQNNAPATPPQTVQHNGYVQNIAPATPPQTVEHNGYVQNIAPATPPKVSQNGYGQNNAPATSPQTVQHNGYVQNIAPVTPPKTSQSGYAQNNQPATLPQTVEHNGYVQNIVPVTPPKTSQSGYAQNNGPATPPQTVQYNGYVQNIAPATPPKNSQSVYAQNNGPAIPPQTVQHNGYGQNIAPATPPKNSQNGYDPANDQALLQTINQIVGQINQNSGTNGAQVVQNPTPWVVTNARPYEVVPNHAGSATIQSTVVYNSNNKNHNNNNNNNYIAGVSPSAEKDIHGQQVSVPCIAMYGNVAASTADVGHGVQIDKTYSTFVPKGQSQHFNEQNQSEYDKQDDYGVYGKPGANAFSNFAPGNEPYRPPPLPAGRSNNYYYNCA